MQLVGGVGKRILKGELRSLVGEQKNLESAWRASALDFPTEELF